ncbi:hypothetical protein GPECTOR_49g483 [Gonium pectorale]|uniref:Guanylate cyclase domain-containing protein n=1 Tax=Gonium pectorale TaxID=33097 RepID=A0A150G7R2_GONPE|nr:hypothetical protein GPECTOR_49g483 [Gonium pectorale]|eukprot:KXZ45899.1 hypothetical protein GPECTOR_49g483 [Gonium pectorale]
MLALFGGRPDGSPSSGSPSGGGGGIVGGGAAGGGTGGERTVPPASSALQTARGADGREAGGKAGQQPEGHLLVVPRPASSACAPGAGEGSTWVTSSGARRASSSVFPQRPTPAFLWHEVTATRRLDPVSGALTIVLMQTDVTAKVEAERHIAFVTEAQHRLLEDMFPHHVLAYMTEEGGPWNAPPDAAMAGRPGSASCQRPAVRDINKLATSHGEVTLLFADIQGFTPMCKTLEPRVVMAFLNDLFTRFDSRLQDYGVYKVETIGDCYFVAGGLIGEDETGTAVVRSRKSQEDPQHARRAMLSAASQVRLPTTGGPVRMRIGIHTGPVVSGVVGQRMPRFCLFGDTVNTASRMESTGVPGCIHASETAQALLQEEDWLPTGGIEVRGDQYGDRRD